MKVEQLYWSAGFIDGEGSFGRAGGSITVSAVQVDKWHIDKLVKLFGGNINVFTRKEVKSNNGVYHRWQVYGSRAASIMMTLYPLLSPRRQEKIKYLLADWIWRSQKENHNRQYYYCEHDRTKTTFINSKGYKECRACKTESNRRYRKRLKEKTSV